ncbi:hypothetical protein [Vulcanisaeta sp. JCM 16159]|uniref:hypothetical protein n=1 Tax=Vulcanisaeta sp. JCM 16159 TaxID=1295371 RepID=UPI000AB9BEA4|nr:hypothetical protein [Vulcanisaeta sp. JCM 16159]
MNANFEELIRDFIIEWCATRRDRKCTVNEEYLKRQAKVAEDIYSELNNANRSRLVILKAPTGSGKTEILASVFLMQWRTKDWFAGSFTGLSQCMRCLGR